jgi:6-phosphogluconolactonase
MSEPRIAVAEDEHALAHDVAEALALQLASPGDHHLVVTGGGVGTLTLAALRLRSPSIDWSRVHIWWGDERFLPDGDPDRNETAGRLALLDHVPIPALQVHPMPADRGQGLDAASALYADELARHARDGFVPDFDVVLLGMGPEGHVASLFPHMDALQADTSTAPIPDSPKPPPARITMTLASIRSARRVWIVASGEAKAPAAALAVDPATSMLDLPAAGARGREGTCLWLDRAAASLL